MVDPDLIARLCCPETHQDLTRADAGLLEDLNERIKRGSVKNRAGKPVNNPIDGGLIRSDHRFLYPIRQDIPVMLVEEAIPLE